jgi:endonuclease G
MKKILRHFLLFLALSLFYWGLHPSHSTHHVLNAQTLDKGLLTEIPEQLIPKSVIPSSSYELVKNDGYMAGYSRLRKCPVWTLYVATPRRFNSGPRPDTFFVDPRVGSPDTRLYSHSGFDRGHMVPNEDMASMYGRQSQEQSFFTSNICPQRPALNRECWANLERMVRKMAERLNDGNGVYVYTGPVFSDTPQEYNGISIPQRFYKIIISDKARYCYLYSQDDGGGVNPQDRVCQLGQIEQITGLLFQGK